MLIWNVMQIGRTKKIGNSDFVENRLFTSYKNKMPKLTRDFRFKPYKKMEEIDTLWCLWIGEMDTDYQLCNGDENLLPTLYKKDEVRFEYNQWNQNWSRVSCTIFSAIWMLSDLINYEFSLDEIKEVDELSYSKWRTKGKWRWVQNAVKLVADRYNNSELSKKYWKVAYYRISKYDDEITEWILDKLYTINGNHWLTAEYTQDKKDWMIDWTNFWNITNWHAVDIINYQSQRSVKNSYKWTTNNIYWLKNKLSKITNFWTFFYVYTLVKEDNFERIKELNEFKSNALITIEKLWAMRHQTKSEAFQNELHIMADKLRDKIKDIDEQLKLLS